MDVKALTDDELRQAAAFHSMGAQQANPTTAADLSDDELRQAAQAYGVKVDPDQTRPGRYFNDLTDMAAQGMTFGIADEVGAAGAATADWLMGQSWGDAYDKNLARRRGELASFRKQNPGTAMTAEIVGSFANPLNKAAGDYVGKGASMLSRAGRSATAGGAMGGLYGAGNAEGDLTDRAKGAATGAAVGATVGGVSVPVMEGLGAAGRLVADQTFGRTGQGAQKAAARNIMAALQADGLTPQQAMQRIQQLGPEGALMDVGPNARALARAIYTQPGQGKTIIGDKLVTRQEGTRAADATMQGGQIGRVTQAIDDLIPGSARGTRQAAQATRAAHGADYQAARAAGDAVDVRPVLSSLDDEITKSKGGIRTGLERVRSFLTNDKGAPETSIDALHQAKMAIDDLMSGEARSSMGNVAKSRIRAYQDQLVQAIEGAGEAGAAYRQGRLGTAAAWRINDAVDLGENFMLKRGFSTADEMMDALANMRPEELEAFRTGAAQAIKNKLGDMNVRTDVTKRLKDIPALEQKIKAAFGDNRTFKRYIDALTAEADMFDSYGRIIGGSRTAEVAAEQRAMNGGQFIQGAQQALSPDPSAWNAIIGAINMARGLGTRMTTPEPVREQMARALAGNTLPQLPARPGHFTSQLLAAPSGLAGGGVR